MDAPPDLTVVVLSWNTRDLTLRALAAAAPACAPYRARVVCVDNASDDGTVAAVRARLPHVRVVENAENVGFARGNNAAMGALEGRHVVFLNSDTEASPGSLGAVVTYLDARPAVGVAAPPLVGEDGLPQRSAWGVPTALAMLHQYTPLGWFGVGRRATRRQRDVGRGARTGPVEAVSGAAMVVRRDLAERLGGFDPGYPFYFEDVDLCWRARRAGAEVHFVAEAPTVRHVGGASAGPLDRRLRLPLLVGAVRFQRKRLGPLAFGAFAGLFVLGVVARSLWEIVRAPVVAPLRRLRGHPERARRTGDVARARLRFLERDVAALLRSTARPRERAVTRPAVVSDRAG